MKLDLSTGCLITVEQKELDRRVAAIRGLLGEKNAGLFMAVCPLCGGFRNWLTGTSGPGRPSEGAVLVGRSGDVITVNGGNLLARGAMGERNYAMAAGCDGEIFQGYSSCEGFSADLIEEMLCGSKVIAVANWKLLRADLYEYLHTNLPGVQLIDVSEEVAQIRAKKSAAEQKILEQNARMMDKLFAGAGIYINPLKYEREVVTDLRYAAYRLGCGGVDHLLTSPTELVSAVDGAPKETQELLYPGRRVESGDRVNLKMFALGNDGYFAGMARSYVLGEPQEGTRLLWKIAVEAQDIAARQLRPGVQVGEIAAQVNSFLVRQGYHADESTMIHSIGLSVQEEPQVFGDLTLPVEEDMVFYVGPTVDDGETEPLSCGDLYLVKKERTVRLNHLARELIRLY